MSEINFELGDDPMDAHRAEFLWDLDLAPAWIEVTDWEAKFLESTLGKTSFSPAQRVVIDNLKLKYQNKL